MNDLPDITLRAPKDPKGTEICVVCARTVDVVAQAEITSSTRPVHICAECAKKILETLENADDQ